MVSVDRQQHALEVLKCINKAITNLRLYPEQSVQVSNTVEKAYSELKVFLRLYGTLNFGFHKGVPSLDGVIFERKRREQLDDLALVDFLDKVGLTGMTLAQGLDRKRFKQVLSLFTTHHEQIQKSGGIAAFVKDTGLGAVFLEDSDSDVVQEQIATHSFSDYLQQIMALGVRQAQFSSLLRQGEERPQSEDIRHELTGSKGIDVFVAAVCFVLQDLQRAGVYGVSSGFNQLLENMSTALKEEEIQQVAVGAASKLTVNLDKGSMALLVCQSQTTRFGELLFGTLIAAIDKERFRSLVDFLRQEGERLDGSLNQVDAESSQLVTETCQRLMETGKGRQLHAIENTGAAQMGAAALIGMVGDLGPRWVVATLFAVTVLGTQVIPTAALVVLMAPVALGAASALGISPQLLMMTVAIAASSSFASPLSHPAHLLVMGPGGYKFMDYVKVGAPLTLVAMAVSVWLLPILWPA